MATKEGAYPKASSEEDERRTLFSEDYFSLHLFQLFNPVLKTLRGISRATHLPKMREVCTSSVSIASFSAGQHLFQPEILEEIIRDLCRQVQPVFGDPRLREALRTLTAVDGSILRAVNRMVWAPAAGHGCAIRIHVQFEVFSQVPQDWTITPANLSERKVWAKRVKPGQFYVNDRGYSNDFKLLESVRDAGADFVMRLNGNIVFTPVEAPRPLTAKDLEAGVVWDQVVRLGQERMKGPVFRVVKIVADNKEFFLVTTRLDLAAELIGLIYRYRWQIEVFFKWIKSLWSGAHWIAESPQGVAIQVYTILIGAMMLSIWAGRAPSKRQLEALQLFHCGFTDEAGLAQLLDLDKKSRK